MHVQVKNLGCSCWRRTMIMALPNQAIPARSGHQLQTSRCYCYHLCSKLREDCYLDNDKRQAQVDPVYRKEITKALKNVNCKSLNTTP